MHEEVKAFLSEVLVLDEPFKSVRGEDGRRFVRALVTDGGPGPAMASVKDIDLGSGCRAREFLPVDPPLGRIVWVDGLALHGGTIGDSDVFIKKVAERTGCSVLLTTITDPAETTLLDAGALVASAFTLASSRRDATQGVVPPILIGDGVGATFCAAFSLSGPFRGLRPPHLQILIDPVIGTTPTESESQELFVPSSWKDIVDWLGGGCSLVDLITPTGQGDVTQFPATLILEAELTSLRSGTDTYVRSLRSAGAEVDLHIIEGNVMWFMRMLRLRSSERAFQRIVRSVRSHVLYGHIIARTETSS